MLRDHICYNYSVEENYGTDKNAIRKQDYKDFENAFIERFITSKLGIEKSEIECDHYKVLRMLNI